MTRTAAFQAASAAVAGVVIAWTFYGQRSLLAIGDMCSSSRGIKSDIPCPDGMLQVGLGLPVMFGIVLAASAMAVLREVPAPLPLTWAALFTVLGVNCLDFDAVVWGVVFLVVSLPGWWGAARAARSWWIGVYLGTGALGWLLGWATFT